MNVLGEWGRVIARTLADAGVRDVVVSPGSRSTPYVLAVDAEARLDVHVIVDERSAAFFALGRARVTDRPAALLCTSGTAAANYLPAVVEADAAGIPLVVLTADRPLSLMACGANQTIEQLGLFDGRTRFTLDLGLPSPDASAMRSARRAVFRAVNEAAGADPGPVHLNLRADKPLEPGPAVDEVDHRAERAASEILGRPMRVELSRLAPPAGVLDEIAERIARAARPVLVAGPSLPRGRSVGGSLASLCRGAAMPLLAESTSQQRFRGPTRQGVTVFDFFDLAWGSEMGRRTLAPDLIVQVGGHPVSRSYAELRATGDVERIVVAERGWPDPAGDASIVCRADLQATLEGLAERTRASGRDDEFASRVVAADGALAHLVEETILSRPFGEGAVARVVAGSVPHGGILAVGNSLPVRELDLVCPGRLGDFLVVSQRGVSGIDGLISGAAGTADASGAPTLLYVGDVSMLHDVGGLMAARSLHAPLVIVVANNDGGRIFEQLPVARADVDEGALTRFTTPHGLSFEHAARLYGHEYARVESAVDLREAISLGFTRGATTLVEAVVPPSSAVEERAALEEGAARVLAEIAS